MHTRYNISRLEFVALALLQKCHITSDDMAHLLHVHAETTAHLNSVVCEFIFYYGWWNDELQQRRELGSSTDYHGESTTYWSVIFKKEGGTVLTGEVEFGSPTLETRQVKRFDFLRRLV